MNIINWLRKPAHPPLWTFARSYQNLGEEFFYAPSREHAQAEIIHHMRMNHGDEIGELRWEPFERDGLVSMLSEYDNNKLVEGSWGYLKSVNSDVKTLKEIMDNSVQLSDEEQVKKQNRVEAYLKYLVGSSTRGWTPESDIGYYGYDPSNRNPFEE